MHTYIQAYNQQQKKTKSNMTPPLEMSIALYAPNMKPKWRGAFVKCALGSQVAS